MLHVLLDQQKTTNGSPIMPPKTVVDCVRRLYSQRNPEIRCLLPVVIGLTRTEVLAALPSIVQLQDRLVKEIISRLLRASVECQAIPRADGTIDDCDRKLGPISPEDLVVAIHQLEFVQMQKESADSTEPDAKNKLELKLILRACLHCFAEKKFYTQERLSLAISQLVQLDPVPTLTMRTVMQALALYPRLAGLVITVLARLAHKQVRSSHIWKNSALWDGFVRCCMKTRPQCFQVLFLLPTEQLESVFLKESSLRQHMLRHVENLSNAQRQQIPDSVMELLQHEPEQQQQQKEQTAPDDEVNGHKRHAPSHEDEPEPKISALDS
ncbi:hypothetical protein Ciccas_006935 [Cichlidogyrus casuarinus]|uniref:Symplekin C-terminal domain-containing protein n=1 Tax=Cichlidogyrus casuarinus TaxID=1844966 RepID=A0ABD2Q4A6_9PLAT